MIVTSNALCDDRPVRIDIDSEGYWGFECCDACRSIATARNSWMEVYS